LALALFEEVSFEVLDLFCGGNVKSDLTFESVVSEIGCELFVRKRKAGGVEVIVDVQDAVFELEVEFLEDGNDIRVKDCAVQLVGEHEYVQVFEDEYADFDWLRKESVDEDVVVDVAGNFDLGLGENLSFSWRVLDEYACDNASESDDGKSDGENLNDFHRVSPVLGSF